VAKNCGFVPVFAANGISKIINLYWNELKTLDYAEIRTTLGVVVDHEFELLESGTQAVEIGLRFQRYE
jgi:hypothetical protein